MMHHHFFGLYTQSAAFRKQSSYPRPPFNLPVFYGYFTTMVGFGACLFIPFPLLSQLALYAMISLSVAYINFAFIYPRIGFKPPRLFSVISALRKPFIPSIVFLSIALIGFIYISTQLKLDFDLSKLDYQNKPMLKERAFFAHIQDKDEMMYYSLQIKVRGLCSLCVGLYNPQVR